GYLLKLQSTSSTNSSGVTFQDMATGTNLPTVSISNSNGQGTLTVPDGTSYTVTLVGDNSNSSAERTVRLSYPDGSKANANTAVLYPTIPTIKGAKIAFYQPQLINLSNWDGQADVGLNGAVANGYATSGINLTTLNVPNGNGYGAITFTQSSAGILNSWNVTSANTATVCNLTTAVVPSSCVVQVGKLTYDVNTTGAIGNATMVYLKTPGGANIASPAIIVYEEKDYNNVYNAYVATFTNDSTYMSVNAITDTWSNASTTWSTSVHSNTKLTKRSDYWGAIATTDTSDSHHTVGTISYPDEQVYANLYLGSATSSVSGGAVGTAATQLGDVLVKDSEVSSVSAKNLIVVGGSCINSVAASLLGGSACSADFTTKTSVGTGQFLIQSIASSYSTGKVALVVAGYEAADTANAEKYLTTQVVDTTVGKKYIGTTATTATLTTTSA
ncbi:MAG: hypothetical protein AABX99_02895, partial [Nanoarchaeota archaeon]